MANYACPRCSGPVNRGHSAVAGHAGGLVGMLLYSAFAGFTCGKCGDIPRSEFPDEVRAQMTRNSLMLAVGGVVLLIAAITALVALNS